VTRRSEWAQSLGADEYGCIDDRGVVVVVAVVAVDQRVISVVDDDDDASLLDG
jgi:hypothetical protein